MSAEPFCAWIAAGRDSCSTTLLALPEVETAQRETASM
jgi:hypothetical protein